MGVERRARIGAGRDQHPAANGELEAPAVRLQDGARLAHHERGDSGRLTAARDRVGSDQRRHEVGARLFHARDEVLIEVDAVLDRGDARVQAGADPRRRLSVGRHPAPRLASLLDRGADLRLRQLR